MTAGRFHVRVEKRADAPTLIHWHGLLPPYGQEGVPNLPQPWLSAGQSYDYDFPITIPGTHWPSMPATLARGVSLPPPLPHGDWNDDHARICAVSAAAVTGEILHVAAGVHVEGMVLH